MTVCGGVASWAPTKTPASLSPDSQDRVWKMSEAGEVSISSVALAPACRDAWQIAAASGDGRELLAVCLEGRDFMDAFFHYVLQGVQLVDSTNLLVRRCLKGLHGDPRFALWHGDGQTVIAVLENAEQLKLYTIGDRD